MTNVGGVAECFGYPMKMEVYSWEWGFIAGKVMEMLDVQDSEEGPGLIFLEGKHTKILGGPNMV
jgi:hypothetical protein